VLLGGRFISLAINLAVQVLIVRYLLKAEYGAFAYGIGVASIGATAVLLGLDKATARFVPIFQERGEPRKAFGAIVLAVGVVTGAGLSLVALCFGLRGVIAGSVVSDPLALSLLLILIVLAPVDALDHLLQGLLAIFVGTRAIFLRRHVIGPGLKLAAVLLVIFTSGSAHLLAWGYVVGGVLGLATYVVVLGRAWQKQGVFRHARPRAHDIPAREVLAYSLPLMSSELVLVLRGSFAIVLLEYLQSTSAVAEYRAAVPFARLNMFVLESFTLLFIPVAARMFARRDREGLNSLYWQSALLIAILSFPAFAVMFSLAEPVTILLFGPEYAASAPVLAVLAVGFFFHSALGANQLMLRVCGRVREVVIIDVVAVLVGLGLYLQLIPRFGAMGAAVGTTTTFIIHKLLSHHALVRADIGVGPLDRRYLRLYFQMAGMAVALLLLQSLLDLPIYLSLPVAMLASIYLMRTTRKLVRIEETFPELLRFPLLKWLVR
jgi:O-antigen/teichoic acid export membrane protein